MALFDQLRRLSIGFHRRSQVGDLISHFSTDVAQLSGGVIKMPLRGLKSTLAILFYLPVMFVLEPRLAIAAAGAAPLAVYLVNRYSPDADSALDQEKQEIALVLNEVSENLRAQTAIRAFGLRRRARDRFRQRISSLHASSSIADFRVQLAAALSEYSVALAQVAIVALGAILALGGSLEPGTLAAFVALLVEFAWEATVIGRDVLPEVRKAWSGIRRIDALLANPAPTSSGEGNVTPALDDSVRFEKVSFGYSTGGDSLQLEDVNLSFDAGSYVAVVGASGSGKSTLLSLLLRFYDPTAGQILIDSVPLTELDAEGLRALTGVVFQGTFLFNASLGDNIVLAENSVTDFDLELVLESTGLAEVVRNLPEGLDTIIGAGGRQLSGGQAQRVGLTRALLRNPRLLLLDEATSALDPSTEAAVVETIGRIRHGRTLVMVTHRLETVVDADLIVVMRNGQVDEVGQFEDLLESGRTFAEMWSKQRGFVVGRDGRSASVTADRLAAIPLFSVLSEESLNQIAGDFVAQQHAAETVIFEEGDLGDRFFVIVRGVVEVSKSSGDGEKVVAHLEDGDFFGEMALLDAATRNATVVAVTPTTTLSLDRDQFRAMIEGTPEMAVAVQAVADARSTENGTS
jgi:ATP-binding cassette subfamily B protein